MKINWYIMLNTYIPIYVNVYLTRIKILSKQHLQVVEIMIFSLQLNNLRNMSISSTILILRIQ